MLYYSSIPLFLTSFQNETENAAKSFLFTITITNKET